MSKYIVVEKDVEEDIGFAHKLEYSSKKKAMEWAKMQQKELGEYYALWVVEIEE